MDLHKSNYGEKATLVPTSTNCPRFYKFRYADAQKATNAKEQPKELKRLCTNVPIKCRKCEEQLAEMRRSQRTTAGHSCYMWKYGMQYHLKKVHGMHLEHDELPEEAQISDREFLAMTGVRSVRNLLWNLA